MKATVFLACLFVAACTAPGQRVQTQSWVYEDAELPPEVELIRLSPRVLADQVLDSRDIVAVNQDLEKQIREYEYRVGPRDILIFTVWDHPELTIPAGEFRAPDIQGHLVSAAGDIFFPYVGTVRVAGRTLVEIRDELTDLLSRYINNPQLDVRIAGFRSKSINVSGEVKQPGFFPITDTPMTLVEALNLAGGPDTGAAIQQVMVLRRGETLSFDMVRLLHKGDLNQNVLLQDGDLVFVPKNDYYVVHVLGAVDTPGVVPIMDGRLNLTEAISHSGGFDEDKADASRLFVFRRRADGTSAVFWLDAHSPETFLLATQFHLMPQDVVFVASTRLARWNRVVSLLLPTVQTLWQTQSFIDRLND